MTTFRVIIPEESYSIIEFQQEDLPGVGAVNTALRGFEPKYDGHSDAMTMEITL